MQLACQFVIIVLAVIFLWLLLKEPTQTSRTPEYFISGANGRDGTFRQKISPGPFWLNL